MQLSWSALRTSEQIQDYIANYINSYAKEIVNSGISDEIKRVDPGVQITHLKVNIDVLNSDTREFTQVLEYIYANKLNVDVVHTIRFFFEVIYNDGTYNLHRSYRADLQLIGNRFKFWTEPASGEFEWKYLQYDVERIAAPDILDGAFKL